MDLSQVEAERQRAKERRSTTIRREEKRRGKKKNGGYADIFYRITLGVRKRARKKTLKKGNAFAPKKPGERGQETNAGARDIYDNR